MTVLGLQICYGWRFSPETRMQSPSKPVGERGNEKTDLTVWVLHRACYRYRCGRSLWCKFFECCPIKFKRTMLLGPQP
jgi:hypothetical protein